uniref:Uncharacterized protein n=1 Tax=Arundo donax TaxID=35708 RepID=A0A0A8ZL44_ARUDO
MVAFRLRILFLFRICTYSSLLPTGMPQMASVLQGTYRPC